MCPFFEEKDADDFKLNSKYIDLIVWSLHFCNVCKEAHSLRKLQEAISRDEQVIKAQKVIKERSETCLKDMEIFDFELMTIDRNYMYNFLKSMEVH